MFQYLAQSRWWWMAGSLEWVRANFDLAGFYQPGRRRRLVLSVIGVWLFAIFVFPLMVNYLGYWGVFKFWVMPTVAYLYWVSLLVIGLVVLTL